MHEEKYLTAYFGRQPHYYLSKYLSYHSGDKFQFNADAFFVGIFWFLYRKLFVELLIIFSALIFISVAEELLYIAFAISEAVQNYIFYLSMPVFGTFWGFAGNYLYIKKADKQIAKILASTPGEEERILLLKKRGGISYSPFFLLGAIITCILLLKFTTT